MQLERMTLFPEFKPWSVIAVVLRTTGPQKCGSGCWFRHFQVPEGRKGEASVIREKLHPGDIAWQRKIPGVTARRVLWLLQSASVIDQGWGNR